MSSSYLLITNELSLEYFGVLIEKFLTDTELMEYSTQECIDDVIFPSENLPGDSYALVNLVKVLSEEDRRALYTALTLNWMFNISLFDRFSWGYYISMNKKKQLPFTFRGISHRDTKTYHIMNMPADPTSIHCFLQDDVYDDVLRNILLTTQKWLSDYRNYFMSERTDTIAVFLDVLHKHVNLLECVLKTPKIVR